MVFGQDPTPGKYFCYIANIVGLQTNSQTGRFAGSIVLAERQQKFFVTIEDNKQLPEGGASVLTH
jgi:hypothetical protein